MRGNPGLVLLLLAPALLTGCKAIPGWPTDAPPSSAAAGPNGSERSWVVVAPGSPSASPTIKPAPSPSASPTGFLPTQPAHVDPTPTPACTDRKSVV